MSDTRKQNSEDTCGNMVNTTPDSGLTDRPQNTGSFAQGPVGGDGKKGRATGERQVALIVVANAITRCAQLQDLAIKIQVISSNPYIKLRPPTPPNSAPRLAAIFDYGFALPVQYSLLFGACMCFVCLRGCLIFNFIAVFAQRSQTFMMSCVCGV